MHLGELGEKIIFNKRVSCSIEKTISFLSFLSYGKIRYKRLKPDTKSGSWLSFIVNCISYLSKISRSVKLKFSLVALSLCFSL